MHELLIAEQMAILTSGDGLVTPLDVWIAPEPLEGNEEPPPATEREFIAQVREILPPSAGMITDADLSLVTPVDWESFLANLLGFVQGPTGADQNSYWNDPYDHAPLGEWFIDQWGWLPSVQQMPGYNFYGYMGVDPEFLDRAYGAHFGENLFLDAGVPLTKVENMPFQIFVQGVPLTVVWHSGAAPGANFSQVANQPGDIVVTASSGYFTVHADPVGPTTSSGESPPTGINLIVMNEANAPYIKFLDQALQYLIKDPLALKVLMDAHRLGFKITIVTGDNESRFNETTKTVEWNPGMGLRLTNGGVMSPAMVLIHEIAHRIVNLHGYDAQYGSLEHREIITNYEQIIGQRLGEPTRQNQNGTFFHAPTVTYHTPPTSP